MNDDRVVTVADLRRAGFCVAGQRRWFAAHGMDFRDFVRNGIPASRADEIGDAFARRVVERMRGCDERR